MSVLAAIDFKDANPKAAFGDAKVPLHLVPLITQIYLALAHGEGVLKYGQVNWRESGVKVSTYIGALRRHIGRWLEGEECDPVTKVPHLANALACISIIVDAKHAGVLVDDRPMSSPAVIEFLNGDAAKIWNGMREMFKEHFPVHYTILDNPREDKGCPEPDEDTTPAVDHRRLIGRMVRARNNGLAA